LATAHEVLEAIDNQEVSILDARDVDQYTGAVRRGKRGGHIPGAIHLPREAIFDAPGQLKQPAALWEVIKAAGITKNAINGKSHEPRIIAYCNGGVAATSVLFALSILGFTRLTNYDGSWNEWNLDDKLPVETE
jgi:thiosulfate/3-mercaptopyruvate sulfurtransferase